MVQLTKHIRAAAEGDDDPQHLKMYFPFFLWLVRDFALDLSINGKKVTAREYLDSALQPMKVHLILLTYSFLFVFVSGHKQRGYSIRDT